MINMYEVSETNKMIESENLDVRTITLGISLLDCIDSDLNELNRKIYEKITTTAKDLVSVGQDIEKEFGIPIVNKRISVTPIALVGGAACKKPEDFVEIAKTLDRAAEVVGVNFIGGYSALVSKAMTKSDENLIRSIPQALSVTERICSSVNVGSTKTGINMDAVRLSGEIVKATAEATKERDSLGCAKLVIFCNAPDDNPFMAGAFLGVTEADAVINVGVSGPGVVKKALEKVRGKGFEELCETIKKTAFKVTRVGQLVAGEASERLGVPFGIVDLSLAPTPDVGDSVAEILEEIGLERVGAPGTTAALALLNDQVKKGGVMASSYVGGLSGAFIPVSEDQGMIDAVHAGSLTLEKLEAMTCVCSVGLDMIAIPGKTSASTISGIIADEMAIGMVNQKTTAVRLIPVVGKDVGDTAQFGGLLGYAPIMPVNEFGCETFVLPMPFFIDEKIYYEDITLTQEQFYEKLGADSDISTSQPSPGNVMELWEKVLKEYDESVCIPMSSGLSSTCATATSIAEEYNGRVQVVNNQRISVTQEQSVYDAMHLRDQGKSAAEIREILEREKFQSSIYITVDTLKYLKKGGRITPAAAAIGTVLNLKPVLQIQGEKLDAFAKVRGWKAAKKTMLNAIEKDLNGRFADVKDKMVLGMAYTCSKEDAQEWKQEIMDWFPGYEIVEGPLSLSVACHIGPGAMAVTCMKRV